MTFKAWRAGKAHSLVKKGVSLPKILMMGEWKGKAFLRYGQPDEVDPNLFEPTAVLQAAMDLSDTEDGGAEATMGADDTEECFGDDG